jgi:hypothetical protein
MSKVRFTDALIRCKNRAGFVTGYAESGQVVLTRIEGDVTAPDALKEAVANYVRERPARFGRAGLFV